MTSTCSSALQEGLWHFAVGESFFPDIFPFLLCSRLRLFSTSSARGNFLSLRMRSRGISHTFPVFLLEYMDRSDPEVDLGYVVY